MAGDNGIDNAPVFSSALIPPNVPMIDEPISVNALELFDDSGMFTPNITSFLNSNLSLFVTKKVKKVFHRVEKAAESRLRSGRARDIMPCR